MNRLYNFDYLRGLSALGIMIYHYLTWTLGDFSASSLLGRIGIYGVSIFYVLSGLTLYHVYYQKMTFSKQDLLSFFKKRIFRIFPLLWLVTISAILLSGKMPNFYNLFLNLTGLFGFIKWNVSFSAGIWSIGNELVFYVFFPFFVIFAKSNKPLLIIISVVIFSIYLYFAFLKLNPEKFLDKQWIDYVNPLNHLFLFLGGFLIGLLFNHIKVNNAVISISLILALVLFIYTPVAGNTINLITGVNRLLFTFYCFLICFCFYKMTFKFPKFIHKPLTLLGEISYSLYLFHAIIYNIVGKVKDNIIPFSETYRLIICFIVTIIISYISYEYFEKYFVNMCKKTKKDTQLTV